jgi:hypothetical protein
MMQPGICIPDCIMGILGGWVCLGSACQASDSHEHESRQFGRALHADDDNEDDDDADDDDALQ